MSARRCVRATLPGLNVHSVHVCEVNSMTAVSRTCPCACVRYEDKGTGAYEIVVVVVSQLSFPQCWNAQQSIGYVKGEKGFMRLIRIYNLLGRYFGLGIFGDLR